MTSAELKDACVEIVKVYDQINAGTFPLTALPAVSEAAAALHQARSCLNDAITIVQRKERGF